MSTYEPRVNCDCVLAFHPDENLASGVPSELGLRLARDDRGKMAFQYADLNRSDVLGRVSSMGFAVDQNTADATFVKDNWTGGFGAFTETPGENRPAFGDRIDFLGNKPVLAPRQYALSYKTFTGSVSFATTTPGTITNAGNLLAEFGTGDTIVITGTVSNNGTYTISTGYVAGTIRTTQATTAEGPVTATITVSPVTGAFTDVKPFGVLTFACAGSFVYKVAWTTAGSSYLVNVHYVNGATFTKLHVHNAYLYACAGTSVPYAYSADGTTWVNSGRGNPDDKATEMATLRGVLHKRIGNNHHQLVLPGQTAIDIGSGGTAWSSADQIGDTSSVVSKMLVLQDSLAFAATSGLMSLSGEGNLTEMLSGLTEMAGLARSAAAVSWLNNCIVLPLADGSVKVYQGGSAIPVTPSMALDHTLEVMAMQRPPITQDISSACIAGDFLYAYQFSGDAARIIVLEQVGESQYRWYPYVTSNPLTSFRIGISQIGGPDVIGMNQEVLIASYVNEEPKGPVLWITNTLGKTLEYFLIPLGRDATQGTRNRFAGAGTLYDPWLTFGVPEELKRFDHVEVGIMPSDSGLASAGSVTVTAINEAGVAILDETITTTAGIGISTISFSSGDMNDTVTRRIRLSFNLQTSDAQVTPILLWVKVFAEIMPASRLQFVLGVDVLATGTGPASQDEVQAFLTALSDANLPLTLTDIFGREYTVHQTGRTGALANINYIMPG